MECISMVSHFLLINDNLERKIHPLRGIRQGNLLSLYIFILCVAFLGRELDKNNVLKIGLMTEPEKLPVHDSLVGSAVESLLNR